VALFVRSEAETDLAEAFQWYEARSTGLGFDFLRCVRAVLAAIERHPGQYPIALDDIRKAPLRRFPYVVYYVQLAEATSVLAVMHSRRHPRVWQQRR
jgi:toxin ParE1/3/4